MKHKPILLIIFIFCILLFSCKKDKAIDSTDLELYDMSENSANFTYYKNSSILLPKSSGSGHGQPFLKTRFNSIAATKLDSTGKIISNAVFPEGSLIVKELFDDSTHIGRYAILYKSTSHKNADAKGWVWGYINSDKTVASPSSNKGGSCISCHSQSGNIDYMLMNKYFP
ncbi:MAG: hypothetical protein V4622_10745 [Bacteroidota bacterium]